MEETLYNIFWVLHYASIIVAIYGYCKDKDWLLRAGSLLASFFLVIIAVIVKL